MKAIHKYELDLGGNIGIYMPEGAEILSVQAQNNGTYEIPQIWALVDTNNPLKKRSFQVFGTGHTIYPDPGPYIGTFQLMKGSLVFHVFEEV